MDVHRVTLGEFNPWLEQRLVQKYTPCLTGLVDVLSPVLRGLQSLRANSAELGLALLKEERTTPAIEVRTTRQHSDNIIHLIDRFTSTFPDCPLDYEFLVGFLRQGRSTLELMSRNFSLMKQFLVGTDCVKTCWNLVRCCPRAWGTRRNDAATP